MNDVKILIEIERYETDASRSYFELTNRTVVDFSTYTELSCDFGKKGYTLHSGEYARSFLGDKIFDKCNLWFASPALVDKMFDYVVTITALPILREEL